MWFTIISQLNITPSPPPRCFSKSWKEQQQIWTPSSRLSGFRGWRSCFSESFTGLGGSVGGIVDAMRKARPAEQRDTCGDDEEALEVCGVVGRVGTAQTPFREPVYDRDPSSGLCDIHRAGDWKEKEDNDTSTKQQRVLRLGLYSF